MRKISWGRSWDILRRVKGGEGRKSVLGIRLFGAIWGSRGFLCMTTLSGAFGKSFRILGGIINRGFGMKIEGAVPERMAMLMAFPIMKRNVLVV